MPDRVRLCARCDQPIDKERLRAVPRTHLCVACAVPLDETHRGKFRPGPREAKTGLPGAIKTAEVDYVVQVERNPQLPLRLDHEEE
jgi:hypothetical protein